MNKSVGNLSNNRTIKQAKSKTAPFESVDDKNFHRAADCVVQLNCLKEINDNLFNLRDEQKRKIEALEDASSRAQQTIRDLQTRLDHALSNVAVEQQHVLQLEKQLEHATFLYQEALDRVVSLEKLIEERELNVDRGSSPQPEQIDKLLKQLEEKSHKMAQLEAQLAKREQSFVTLQNEEARGREQKLLSRIAELERENAELASELLATSSRPEKDSNVVIHMPDDSGMNEPEPDVIVVMIPASSNLKRVLRTADAPPKPKKNIRFDGVTLLLGVFDHFRCYSRRSSFVF